MISVRALCWQKSLLLLLLLTSCSAQSTYYVTPTPDTPCPGEPCHTLSQYVTEQYFKNFTGNVRMEFLPGNHTLEQTISLTNLTQLTLHGDSSSFPEVTSRIMVSVCDSETQHGFVFADNTELHISVLAFISGVCGGEIAILGSEQKSDITYSVFQNIPLYVHKSILSALTGNTFQNTESQALYAQYSSLKITGNIFQNNFADKVSGGALYVKDCDLNLTGNIFRNNSAAEGGALYVMYGNHNLTGNIFQNSSAAEGGALYVLYANLNLTGNTFQNNSADKESGGALYVKNCNLNLTENIFQNNSAAEGGALYVMYGNLNLARNAFHNNSAYMNGGALFSHDSVINLVGNSFQANLNGALYVEYGNFKLTRNTFHNNSARMGGALYIEDGTLDLTGNTFDDNSAVAAGGALYAVDSILDLTGNTFHNNSAILGGALAVTVGDDDTVDLTGNTFHNNFALEGGALSAYSGNLNLTGNTFHNNSAHTAGGALYVEDSTLGLTGNMLHNNSAIESGGALSLKASDTTFTDNNFTDSYASSGGAIAAAQSSNVRLFGNNIIANNKAQYGGGITIVDSQLELVGSVFTVKNNTASYGGGLYVHNTSISGKATVNANSATEGGGGIYASRSTFYFMGNTTFMKNSAIDGGGLLLSDDSVLYLQQNTHVYFTSNIAKRNGGAIKVEESNPITYCTETYSSDCFIQIQKEMQRLATISEIKVTLVDLNVTIHFDNNSAVEAGADLHGGSVDNCELKYIDTHCKYCPTSGNVLDDITSNENRLNISSDPLHICTCRDHLTDCSGSYYPEPVYPGGTLKIPVIARGQRNGSTTSKMQVIDTPDSNIMFQETETIQETDKNCTTLKYTIQSTAEHSTQEMTLYAEGPCPPKIIIHSSPTKMNTLRVLIDILDCPPGFQLSQTQPAICICTERLQQFTDTCLVDDKTVLRERDAQFWVGYDNHSGGVILHPHCPFDYCISAKTYMAVDDSDKQCNYDRSGLLCGRCSQNLSLALGSSGCLQCSNSYLTLLAAFFFAGIALVVFLLVLRLTVAVGTINGLIFYANVVAVNSAIFFQPQASSIPTVLIAKVLTVFIAWLNLDLGIETCFYNGMDAYVKTWLQFAFPLYVWVLVGMIILGSYYSGRVAKIFGNNPIAVLATLFLLSYAKLLRTVIAALSYTTLEYPNNSLIAVWLYDGNIRYLRGKHIPLFIAAVVCLIFLFLPYTMLLILGQWIQARSKFRIFSWINGRNLRPFLDAYHAPYTNRHRYWTGLMLLLRFVLFLISAVNALGDPSVNLLAIISTTIVMLTLPTILGTRIYKTWCLSLLEISFILNLAILSAATYHVRLTGDNQNAATLTSVGIAFATFTGIVIFHSVQQIKATRLWRRMCLRHDYIRVPLTDVVSGPEDPPDAVFMSGSAPTQTVVDIRDYELREPCMATD